MNPLLKLLQKIAMAFDLNEDALGRVRYVAIEFQFRREAVNKRAKADSLNGTAHDYFQSFVSGSSLRRARRARPTGIFWRDNNRFHIA